MPTNEKSEEKIKLCSDKNCPDRDSEGVIGGHWHQPDKLAEAKKLLEIWNIEKSDTMGGYVYINPIHVAHTDALLAAQSLISYERGREDQKKESVAKKQYGNEEIQKMFEKLIPKLQDAGIHGFSDSQKWARIYAKHLVNLQKKLGEEEFDRRVDTLLSNSFHRQNCNKIKYLYNNINGFIEPKSNISTLVL